MREMSAQPVEEDNRPSDVPVGGFAVVYDPFDEKLERRLFVLQGCEGDVGTVKRVGEVFVADSARRLRGGFSVFGETSGKCDEPRRDQAGPLVGFFRLRFLFERRGCARKV